MATRFLLFLFICLSSLAQITNVNLGSSANDGTGDSLRTAFSKANTNTAWLASQLKSSTNASTTLSNLVGITAQSTVNNWTVSTNLVSGYISLSGINFAQGTYIASDEQDLAYFNPLKAGRVIVKTGTVSGEWYWDSTSTATAGDGVIEAVGYVTGRWIRSIGASTPNVLSGSRGVVFNSSKQIVQSDATKQQIDKTAMNVATIADARLLSTNLNNGQLVYVGGYYTNGDGGGGVFRYDSSDTSSTDNGGTVIVGTSSGIRLKRVVDGPVNILAWGAKGDSSTDNVSAFRKAVTNTPTIYLPAGEYAVSGSISIPSNLVMTGEAANRVTITASSTNFILTFQAATDSNDENTGFQLSGIKFSGKNCIKFSDGTNSFSTQRSLLQGRIENCYFRGTYSTGIDTNANSSVAVTESELLSYGVAIHAAKLFDWYFRNIQVEYFGIGAYLVGCDINNLDNNRFAYNARHVHMLRVGTYGSQNKISNSDLLLNFRVGAIYDKNFFTSIKDNYFETYTAAAQFVIAEDTIGTLFWGNRIDSSSTNTPLMSLAPRYDYVVANNRYNPSTPNAPITVLPTYWDLTFQSMVKFSGNSANFPATRWPQCWYDEYSNTRVWDAWSPKYVYGTRAQTYFWSTNAVTSLPCVTGTDTLFVRFPTVPTDGDLLVQISGVSVAGASGFLAATWGGSSVLVESLGITETNNLVTVLKTIRRPISVLPTANLDFELVTSQTAYHGITLTPVNYQLLEAAPTSGTWAAGDQVIKRTPVVGQPKGWSCTVSGTPGTWVSTGNL